MEFLRSEYHGLLPKHFAQGQIPNITRKVPSDMNDANLEEPSRYVELETCDFLIDLDNGKYTKLEPNYSKMVKKL